MKSKLLLISFLLLSCLSADKQEQTIVLPVNSKSTNNWEIEQKHSFTKNGLQYEILYLKPSDKLIYGLFHNLVVDNIDSAAYHLSSNYIITIAIIENSTKQNKKIVRQDLSVNYRDESLSPIVPLDYPKSIKCINWKGNLKNAYNISVISVSTLLVVGSIVACAKENKCKGLEYIDDVISLATSGETKPENSFSNPIFTSKLESSEMEIGKEIEIASREKKEILILYKKPALDIDPEKILAKTNCLVD
ncbi:hypothetical protein [Leptospira sp. GIMC2001]|uniref:hypothetical protein n=1 Tax=Leptospira sp. GIMC2001 TaxID=1513297 RepID=UPI00234AA647|nr:hypothetical protein [Leptospira sp. GIMC2001]WCL50437.1 hypothetical protein O4O04_06350 [Leptospira sp. GIMC2001]